MRALITRDLQRREYQVENEYAVAGSFADLHATKSEHEVFGEIETGKSDLNANVEKCKALDGTVVSFFVSDILREAHSIV